MKYLRLLIIYTVCSLALICGLQSQTINLVATGNSDYETTVIDSVGYKKLFSSFNALQAEIFSLKDKLESIGFIETKLVNMSKVNDLTYHAIFNLGKTYDTIYIYYDNTIVSEGFLSSLVKDVNKSYFKIDIREVSAVLSKINTHIADKGYTFSYVKLSSLKKQANTKNIEAILLVDLNSKRTTDKIIVKGYENFPKSFLKHYLKLKPNTNLNINNLKERVEILNALPFANLSRDPEILFTQDSTTVYLYLEKRKSNTFDGFLGFGTNETSNKLELSGYLDVSLTNNLNYGESVNIIYKSDDNDQKTFNANISAPYIFKSPLGIELDLGIFKKDSTFTTARQSANILYPINNTQTVSVGLTSIQSDNLSSNTQQPNIEDYNSIFYNLQYQITKPQYTNLLFPDNFYFNLKIGTGNRNHKDIKTKQTLYEVSSYKIFNLNTKNSIFLKANSKGVHSKDYFFNELLRFGGINSIRGFDENSLLATFYGVVNLEYRYSLSPSIYIHSITDVAYLDNNLQSVSENLYGFGFGLGMLTKAGLLKLNYANGKNKGQKFKLSNSKIHISLTAKF